MFQDQVLKFSNSQAVAATDTFVFSTVEVDLAVARNVGSGEPIQIVITIETIPTAGTSIEARLMGDTVTPVDASSIVLAATGAIARTAMTAGQQLILTIPASMVAYKVLGLGYYCTGAIAGAVISAAISVDAQTNVQGA